ncbi:hypothetical protein CEY04_22120 [Achromobacter sp. HZ28]|nr:hypothetical protein CEY04_22120 [Achromobacter sp. HZ28]
MTQPALQTTLGATIFASTCAACHDQGAPMMRIGGRPSLALSRAATADDPRNAINMVLHGIPQEGSAATPYMPSFGAVLDDAQVAQVLDYMRVQIAHRPAWPNLQDAVTAVRKEAVTAQAPLKAQEQEPPQTQPEASPKSHSKSQPKTKPAPQAQPAAQPMQPAAQPSPQAQPQVQGKEAHQP